MVMCQLRFSLLTPHRHAQLTEQMLTELGETLLLILTSSSSGFITATWSQWGQGEHWDFPAEFQGTSLYTKPTPQAGIPFVL